MNIYKEAVAQAPRVCYCVRGWYCDALCKATPARALRPQVLDALVDRLTDPEEKVRQAAVAAICTAAVADLQVRSARRERRPAAPGTART